MVELKKKLVVRKGLIVCANVPFRVFAVRSMLCQPCFARKSPTLKLGFICLGCHGARL